VIENEKGSSPRKKTAVATSEISGREYYFDLFRQISQSLAITICDPSRLTLGNISGDRLKDPMIVAYIFTALLNLAHSFPPIIR